MNVGVSGEELARFRTFADVGFRGNPRDDGAPGPTVLLALRAEKSGRAVELDLTFAGLMVSGDERGLRQVRADAVDLGPLGVEPERLLADEVDGALRFDPIANADTDGDGRVTGAELAAAPAPRVSQGIVSGSLSDVLGGRCANILVMSGPTTPSDIEGRPRSPLPEP